MTRLRLLGAAIDALITYPHAFLKGAIAFDSEKTHVTKTPHDAAAYELGRHAARTFLGVV